MSNWKIDPAHSSVTFKVKHLGVAWVRGQFQEVRGDIEFSPEELSTAKFTGTVNPASISTGNEQRDGHLKSPDFFDIENYPEVKFETTSIESKSEDSATLTGNLTIKGTTKVVSLEIKFHGVQESPQQDGSVNEVAAFSATTTIDRTDFGLDWNMDIPGGKKLVGNKIELSLETEAIKQ